MNKRKLRDFICSKAVLTLTLLFSVFFLFVFILLLYQSLPVLNSVSLRDILFSSLWNPEKGSFGLYSVIYGTILVTGMSLLIAVPISLLSAAYLTEYASKRVKNIIRPFLDVLAGIPSVVYGLCAFVLIVPLIKDYIAPLFGAESTGFCILSAALILAVMVFPIIISLCIEAFSAVPIDLREASLSLGATRWQTMKKIIFRVSLPSIISAVLLGFGRAFGETIAVNMVVGGISRVPSSVFQPGQTMASLIASAYGEMMSIPLYKSVLLLVALILFISVSFFNILGRVILMKTRQRWST